MHPRPKLAAHDVIDLVRAISVISPTQIRGLDANRLEDSFEHQFLDVAPVRECDALCQPIRSSIAIVPLAAGSKDQGLVSAALLLGYMVLSNEELKAEIIESLRVMMDG